MAHQRGRAYRGLGARAQIPLGVDTLFYRANTLYVAKNLSHK